MSLPIPRRGICSTCGRRSVGILKGGIGRECEGECPRCGCSPFYLDSVEPWLGNVALMDAAEAFTFIRVLSDEEEVEVLMRLEFLGQNRDFVLQALKDRYWTLHDCPPSATARGRALTLDELRIAWSCELSDDRTLRLYQTLREAA